MNPIALRHARWQASVAPHWGGSLLSLAHEVSGHGWVPVLRPYLDTRTPSSPNALACYPLLPWSNRVGQGRFLFEGQRHTLTRNVADEPCPIHGHAWQARWSVQDSTPDAVTLSCAHQGDGPFAYTATLHYALDEAGLHCTLSVRNTGPRLPFGAGLHPFFIRTPDVTLQAPTRGRWHAGADRLPIAHEQPVSADWGFNTPRSLPRTLIDHAYSGWSGVAELAWPSRGLRVRLQADVDHLVIYTPPGEHFFCLEPVDHPINALNLPRADQGGLTVLDPGATLIRHFHIGTA